MFCPPKIQCFGEDDFFQDRPCFRMFQQPQIPDTFYHLGVGNHVIQGRIYCKTQTHVAPCHGCPKEVRHSLSSNCLTERPCHQWLPGFFSQRKNVSYHKMVPFMSWEKIVKKVVSFQISIRFCLRQKLEISGVWENSETCIEKSLMPSFKFTKTFSPHLEEGWDCLASQMELNF